jgi:hypothetical protein
MQLVYLLVDKRLDLLLELLVLQLVLLGDYLGLFTLCSNVLHKDL